MANNFFRIAILKVFYLVNQALEKPIIVGSTSPEHMYQTKKTHIMIKKYVV